MTLGGNTAGPGGFTHLDERGRPRMVDVGAKEATRRTAVAEGRLITEPATVALLQEGGGPKGDALAVARVAGIQGAKHTADLIPLCHPLPLDRVEVEVEADPALPGVRVRATASATARTGVEMEALSAVSAALLTAYDMLKSLDRGMRIEGIQLLRKEGGRSGTWIRADQD
ncbi:MAG: cyclic pyranopterin monophosphate synthase MoaC [Gemmatimonadota bacterium]